MGIFNGCVEVDRSIFLVVMVTGHFFKVGRNKWGWEEVYFGWFSEGVQLYR